MKRITLIFLTAIISARGGLASACNRGYVIAVSRSTYNASGWGDVVAALQQKHPQATVLIYRENPAELRRKLKKIHPRHTCFVRRPEETDREFVIGVHQLCRGYDDDPYTDTLWAILTGYDAANALRIAECREPLIIRKVAAGTEIALEMIEQGGWHDEIVPGRRVWKEKGGEALQTKVRRDSTKALVDTLNAWKAECFVASGHATERDWQLGHRYKNGCFKCENGILYGEDTNKQRHPVNSPNPKVYLPVGNCLMGHINSRNAMALAWMNSAGVTQMIGYIKPTWFGYAGWGTLDYFIEQPGRYSLIEAFFANHHALIHKLKSEPSKGLEFDRDIVAVYGDPAWHASLLPRQSRWTQRLTQTNGVYTFSIIPNRGQASFLPVNTNGSQRGGRPIVEFFPQRIATKIEIIRGSEYKPVISDDFILVPNPGKLYDGAPMEIRFRPGSVAAD